MCQISVGTHKAWARNSLFSSTDVTIGLKHELMKARESFAPKSRGRRGVTSG